MISPTMSANNVEDCPSTITITITITITSTTSSSGEQPDNGNEQRRRLSSLDSPAGGDHPQKCPWNQVSCSGLLFLERKDLKTIEFLENFHWREHLLKVLSEREHIADYMQVPQMIFMYFWTDWSDIMSKYQNLFSLTISHLSQSTLDEATDPWGVKVERVEM